MTEQKEEEKICFLCGRKIEKKKGMSRVVYESSLARGAHIDCIKTRDSILKKHHATGIDFLASVADGMFQLFPELAETKSMKEFKKRVDQANSELEKAFPYVKKKEENRR